MFESLSLPGPPLIPRMAALAYVGRRITRACEWYGSKEGTLCRDIARSSSIVANNVLDEKFRRKWRGTKKRDGNGKKRTMGTHIVANMISTMSVHRRDDEVTLIANLPVRFPARVYWFIGQFRPVIRGVCSSDSKFKSPLDCRPLCALLSPRRARTRACTRWGCE